MIANSQRFVPNFKCDRKALLLNQSLDKLEEFETKLMHSEGRKLMNL